MIRDFTDRRPGLSAIYIAAGLFLIPAPLLFLDNIILGGILHVAAILFYLSLIVQTVMFFTVERPILIGEPFIIGLVGLCAGEIMYAIGRSVVAPDATVSPVTYFISSYLIAVCGANASAAIGALIIYIFICIVRKIVDFIKEL